MITTTDRCATCGNRIFDDQGNRTIHLYGQNECSRIGEHITYTAITAASVSAYLRRQGFNPVAASDRSREGIRCTKSGHAVHVVADLNSTATAERLMEDVETALLNGGYTVDRTGLSFSAYVSR